MAEIINIPIFDLSGQRNISAKESSIVLNESTLIWHLKYSADVENEDTGVWERIFEYYYDLRYKEHYRGYRIKKNASENSEYDTCVMWLYFTGADDIKILFKETSQCHLLAAKLEKWAK